MRRRGLPVLLLLLTASTSNADGNAWKFGGYYKNLFVHTETSIGTPQEVTLDLNRLRLELQHNWGQAASFDLQYDNELLWGNYLETEQFRALDLDPPAALDLEHVYAHDDERLARHRVYRATLQLHNEVMDLTLGRQRIAWGTGRFWSPLDVLNPFDPVRIERDERVGVDSAVFDFPRGALGKFELVYAANTSMESGATAGYFHSHIGATDYSFVVGDFRGERMAGADFAGHLGEQGVRGELTITRPRSGAAFMRALLGFDYSAQNTLNLTFELYFNGSGETSPEMYPLLAPRNGGSLAQKYAGASASYEITPVIKISTYLVMNFDDQSHAIAPQLAWSLSDNLELAFGAQTFAGPARSEFGRLKDVYYAQVQMFF